MNTIEIRSHLTKKQWMHSWKEKVVEDTKENRRAYHSANCFYGQFFNDSEFKLYHHKEFEGNGLNTFFFGKVEKSQDGCVITGTFKKKSTANIFLIFAAILTGITSAVMLFNGNMQLFIAPAALFVIVLLCYFIVPASSRELLTGILKDISFTEPEKKQIVSAAQNENRDQKEIADQKKEDKNP